MTLHELENVIASLSNAEKIQILQWIASDLGSGFQGIESSSTVLGGEACIVRTRIPVWVLVQMRSLGASEADILRSYPTLRAADLANAWAYARVHLAEINRAIHENEMA